MGKLTVRTGPAPRERSATDTTPWGGDAAGMNRSTPVRNGNPNSTGIGVLTLLAPSDPTSNANTPIARLSIGAVAALITFVPLIDSWSLSAPWSPQNSL